MKNKMIIFIKLMKKYSQIFSNITENLFSLDKNKKEKMDKSIIEKKAKIELKSTVKQFNKLLFNPKLSENIFQSTIDNDNDNDILEEDNLILTNNINNNSFEDKKEDINKEDIYNLIEKYESKINILLSENEILKMNKDNQTTVQNDLIIKNNDLEKENNEYKISLNEYNIKYDNLLAQYNEMKNKMKKIENDNSILIKENQDLKNDIINLRTEINPNEDIQLLKNELSYKNSVIKYLEEILYNNNNKKEGEESLRDEYEKNLKKLKNNSGIFDSVEIKNDLIINNKKNHEIKKIDNKDKNKNNNKSNTNNNINNNKKKLKINEQLFINNTDSNEDFGNKDINFEYSNDNVNQIDNLLVSKESKNDINKINKNLEQMTKPQKIKEDIENLDEEILEIQSKLKEMLQQ